jgi:hypothetical protein
MSTTNTLLPNARIPASSPLGEHHAVSLHSSASLRFNGYWFFGRPTIEELRQDLRAVLKKCRTDWDIRRPELKAEWERGERDRFYPYGKTYGQVFREQE